MSYPIKYPTPQSANIQIFQEGGSTSDWVKPQGASFVWFTLIGAGGGGDGGSTGGGSGAVTNCMVPAFLIPDVLRVFVGAGGLNTLTNTSHTKIIYQAKNSNGYTLLTANSGSAGGSQGTATASNYFSCMGIYQSIDGDPGGASPWLASPTTFLSGGTTANQGITANYGYRIPSGLDAGFFQMQPIIVGVGSQNAAKGATGCGGGANATGGDGMVVIITW
jgi:hypothetical protein